MDQKKLLQRIKELELENAQLKKSFFIKKGHNTVSVPDQFKPIFNDAEELVYKYFQNTVTDPSKGIIEINNERYVLLRASSLSVDFFNKLKDLYADKGDEKAHTIGRNFLFDIAHVIGSQDAKNFIDKMEVEDPISKLSAGPVHFAYTGWAYVEILEESNPTPDDNFYLKYNHPYSFEADSWIKSGEKSAVPVCIMNSAYSSGWCEQSFGIALTAVEITCRAKGDDECSFVMAPPHKIQEYIKTNSKDKLSEVYDVPLFFERKKAEEAIRQSLSDKNILLKEVHHRVKNNLQIISSLLNLQSNYLTEKQSVLLFKETQNRIKTLALVHEKLYKSEDVEYVELNDYVRSIVDLLSYSYNIDNVKINYDFDGINIEKFEIEKAIPCGLIINEIISNSFKYAFVDMLNGTISIKISVLPQAYELIIEDNGPGIPSDVDLDGSDSLGLVLINSLVEQLEGIVTINSKNGTRFEIQFPMN